MKKKNLFYLLSIVMVAMMSVSFVSCGDDDDNYYDPSVTTPLVGVWQYQGPEDPSNYWWRLVFYKDGTGVETEYSNDGVTDITLNNKFNYTYRSSTGQLIINYTTGNGGTDVYSVERTGNTLNLFYDTEGHFYLFKRV